MEPFVVSEDRLGEPKQKIYAISTDILLKMDEINRARFTSMEENPTRAMNFGNQWPILTTVSLR